MLAVEGVGEKLGKGFCRFDGFDCGSSSYGALSS